jgi:hypothetical protein
VKTLLSFLALASSLFVLNGCSSGNNPMVMQTVMAQTGYSNASLTGTYSVVWTSIGSPATTDIQGFYGGVGTLALNGTGGITGGTLNFYPENTTGQCVYSATGTYSLQSTALGTANLSLSSTTKGCPTPATWQVSLAAANAGSVIQMARSDGAAASGSAVKQ